MSKVKVFLKTALLMFTPWAVPHAEAAELAVAGVASKVSSGGAGLTLGGFVFSNEFAVVSGFLFAFIGVIANVYYRHRADARAEKLHKLREDYIRKGRRTDTDLGDLGDLGWDD